MNEFVKTIDSVVRLTTAAIGRLMLNFIIFLRLYAMAAINIHLLACLMPRHAIRVPGSKKKKEGNGNEEANS
ncbi:MAG: hypothetical protein KF856_17435 [Cyclobacteriaceae bacterium]|nr:hypothetical protein [Cyclobacteriaceae bacterium]